MSTVFDHLLSTSSKKPEKSDEGVCFPATESQLFHREAGFNESSVILEDESDYNDDKSEGCPDFVYFHDCKKQNYEFVKVIPIAQQKKIQKRRELNIPQNDYGDLIRKTQSCSDGGYDSEKEKNSLRKIRNSNFHLKRQCFHQKSFESSTSNQKTINQKHENHKNEELRKKVQYLQKEINRINQKYWVDNVIQRGKSQEAMKKNIADIPQIQSIFLDKLKKKNQKKTSLMMETVQMEKSERFFIPELVVQSFPNNIKEKQLSDKVQNMFKKFGILSAKGGKIKRKKYDGGYWFYKDANNHLIWERTEQFYVGSFNEKKNKKDGFGFEYKPEKFKYRGEYKNGLKHGKGKMMTISGLQYFGDWKDDLKDGYGEEIDEKGNIYKGSWKKNKKQGKGQLTQSDGEKYIGHFKQGKMNGQGKYISINGQIFEGEFKNGFRCKKFKPKNRSLSLINIEPQEIQTHTEIPLKLKLRKSPSSQVQVQNQPSLLSIPDALQPRPGKRKSISQFPTQIIPFNLPKIEPRNRIGKKYPRTNKN